MAFFQKVPNLIPINPDNVVSNDWIILLEANTIVDSSGELRVARTTKERKIVKRFRSFRLRPFLVVDGYDPRIHTLYFCPQLYKHDEHGRLVPLEGDEIGRLLAKALAGMYQSQRVFLGGGGAILALIGRVSLKMEGAFEVPLFVWLDEDAIVSRCAFYTAFPLRALYCLPHAVRRRGHIDMIDAEWSQRINDRIDDDRWSPDGTGFADALHANWIGLAANFF
jgi:hypothetical protein